jgi:hypothetical protein
MAAVVAALLAAGATRLAAWRVGPSLAVLLPSAGWVLVACDGAFRAAPLAGWLAGAALGALAIRLRLGLWVVAPALLAAVVAATRLIG